MENNTKQAPTAKGGQVAELPTKETIRQWVKRDVGAAAYFLSMLLRDQDTMDDLADILYERYKTDQADKAMLGELDKS